MNPPAAQRLSAMETEPRAPSHRRAGAWRGRGRAFFILWILCALATSGAVSSALGHGTPYESWGGTARFALALPATILGPFLGGFARDWQSCCAANSWSLLPYAASPLVLGLALQWVPFPATRLWGAVRLAGWTAGWFAWFAAGVLSCGHALE